MNRYYTHPYKMLSPFFVGNATGS